MFSGMIERWEILASQVEQAQMASALHRELAVMRTEFKATCDRLFDCEIALEQPHVLDDRINGITVSFFSCTLCLVLVSHTFLIHTHMYTYVLSRSFKKARFTLEASWT